MVSVLEHTRQTVKINTTTFTHDGRVVVIEKNTLLYSTSLLQQRFPHIAIIPKL